MFQESVDKSGNSSRKDVILFILLAAAFFAVGAVALHLERVVSNKAPRYIFIALALIAVYLIYKFRLAGFRYTIFYKAPKPEFDPRFNDMMLHEDYPYPVGTIVFEKTASAKGAVLAAVSRERIRAFLKPGESFAGSENISENLNVSCGKTDKAHSLIYEKDGKLFRIYFRPSEEFIGYINIILSDEFETEAETVLNAETAPAAEAETALNTEIEPAAEAKKEADD